MQSKTVEIPLQTREAAFGAARDDGRTVPITWTTGAAVRRIGFDGEPWIEELSTEPSAVRMGRLKAGAPLLNNHNRNDIKGVIGVIESPVIANGKGTAVARFSRRPDVEPIYQDVRDKIIRNVSVGYTVYRYEDITTLDDSKHGMRRLKAVDWEPAEVSLVPVGADAAAGVRAAEKKNPCVINYAERTLTQTTSHQARLRWSKQIAAERN